MRVLAFAGCIAAALCAPSAQAGNSIYTDVESCRVHDTGWDEFLIMCKGPDGLAGILHYVEGRAFTVFGTGGGEDGSEIVGQPFNIDDEPIAVGGSGKVFGPKIEWVRSDSGKVCAAIVRVSTDKGSRLVATALTGTAGRISLSVTNEQARTDAETACGEAITAAARPATGVSQPASISGEASLPAQSEISAGVKRGLANFDEVYKIEGIWGALGKIESCYEAVEKEPSVAKLAECGAMDIMAANVDGYMSSQLNMPRQEFFSEKKIDRRISAGVKSLNLTAAQQQSFGDRIMEEIGR